MASTSGLASAELVRDFRRGLVILEKIMQGVIHLPLPWQQEQIDEVIYAYSQNSDHYMQSLALQFRARTWLIDDSMPLAESVSGKEGAVWGVVYPDALNGSLNNTVFLNPRNFTDVEFWYRPMYMNFSYNHGLSQTMTHENEHILIRILDMPDPGGDWFHSIEKPFSLNIINA